MKRKPTTVRTLRWGRPVQTYPRWAAAPVRRPVTVPAALVAPRGARTRRA